MKIDTWLYVFIGCFALFLGPIGIILIILALIGWAIKDIQIK